MQTPQWLSVKDQVLWGLQPRSCLVDEIAPDTQQAPSLAIAEADASSEREKLNVAVVAGSSGILYAPKAEELQVPPHDPELVEVASHMLMAAPQNKYVVLVSSGSSLQIAASLVSPDKFQF